MTETRRNWMVFVAAAVLLVPAFAWLLHVDDAGRTSLNSSDLLLEPEPSAMVLSTKAADFRSRWVSQSAPNIVPFGKIATVSFVFRNTGTASWERDTAAEARLGIVGDDTRWHALGFAVGWPTPNRPAIQVEDSVAVGDTATFTFRVLGAVTGLHRIAVRPVVDGVTWMDDEGAYVEFLVSATP